MARLRGICILCSSLKLCFLISLHLLHADWVGYLCAWKLCGLPYCRKCSPCIPHPSLLTQTHILETGIIYVCQRFEAAVVAAVIFVCGIAKKKKKERKSQRRTKMKLILVECIRRSYQNVSSPCSFCATLPIYVCVRMCVSPVDG